MGAQQACTDLGHELFGRDRSACKLLAHVTADAMARHGRMHALMIERRRIIFGRVERCERRHAASVLSGDITGDVTRRDAFDLQLQEPRLMQSYWRDR